MQAFPNTAPEQRRQCPMEGLGQMCLRTASHNLHSQKRGFTVKRRQIEFRVFHKAWDGPNSVFTSKISYLQSLKTTVSFFPTCPLHPDSLMWDDHRLFELMPWKGCQGDTFLLHVLWYISVACRYFLYIHPGIGIASRNTITLHCTVSSVLLIGRCRVKGHIIAWVCPVVPRTTGKTWVVEKKLYLKCMVPYISVGNS